MSVCKACGAPINWIKMVDSGKMMPVDEKMQYFITVDKSGTVGNMATGYTPHWSTCPKADQFRKK